MSDIQKRVEAIEKKLQLRLLGSTFTRQLAENSGDPVNWVLGIGEMQMPKTFFVAPDMVTCVELAERYFDGLTNPGLHVTASFCGAYYAKEDFIEFSAVAN